MRIPSDSMKLFQNPLMERMTHVHPSTPFIVWLPIVTLLLWNAFHALDAVSIAILGVAGFFSWTLAEYFLHKFLFHLETENPYLKRFVFLLHGIHHAQPEDKTRLVMPPIASIPIGSALYLVFLGVFGVDKVQPFFAFFLLGYLCYDWIHYSTHHFKPQTIVGRVLKKNHMDHHFSKEEINWGVSSPLWDYVFGTRPNKVRHSSTSQV